MEYVHDYESIEDDNQCCICYHPLVPHVPESGRLQPCNHPMHGECILKWMMKKRSLWQTPCCPICRTSIEAYECNTPSPTSHKTFGSVSLERCKFETIAPHLYATRVYPKEREPYILCIKNTLLTDQRMNTNDDTSIQSYSIEYSDRNALFSRMPSRRSHRLPIASVCSLL
jgi:hypothetical protein